MPVTKARLSNHTAMFLLKLPSPQRVGILSESDADLDWQE